MGVGSDTCIHDENDLIKTFVVVNQEIFRFLRNPRKPAILAMSRPDAKKNITTLVKAFGENPTLRELANLVLIMARDLTSFAPKPICLAGSTPHAKELL